jgi:hypothetical protein
MTDEKDLRAAVFEELKELRRVGIVKLDLGTETLSTPLLDEAAKEVPGYNARLTRTAALIELLRYEISQLKLPAYEEWLPVSLGVKDGLKETRPGELRKIACKLAGETNLHNFRRTDGLEQRGLEVLAGQIVAGCLKPAMAARETAEPSTPSPEPVPVSIRRAPPRIAVVAVACVIALAAAASAVALKASARPGPPPDNPTGHAIRTTVLTIGDMAGGQSVVFASEQQDAAHRLVTGLDRQSDTVVSATFVNNALENGAYLYGGMELGLNVEGLDGREATIYDIRPITRRGPIATDTAVVIPPGGGERITRMSFVLDQPHPIAMEVPYGANRSRRTLRPFFDIQRIGLRRGQKVWLTLWFYAYGASFTFDVAIDYEVGGEKYTQIVNNNGQPFRVSAAACPQGLHKANLPPDELSRLSGLRYKTVRGVPERGGNGLVPVSPETYVAECARYLLGL